jgi:hypothetical protein
LSVAFTRNKGTIVGVQTDFFVADTREAELICESDDPFAVFDGIDAKGIGQVEMGTLYAILSDREYDPSFMTTDESFVYTASDDGPWVQLVPSDMVKRLASIADLAIPMIAAKWRETEEFQSPDGTWTDSDIYTFLHDMRQFSLAAVAEAKEVFMLTSP